MRGLALMLSGSGLLLSGIAQAQLTPQIRATLDAAIAGGNEADVDTLAKYLKKANPDEAAEIDRIIADHRSEIAAARQEKLRHQGFLSGWTGEGQVGISQSSGNSDTLGATAGIALRRDGLRWRYNLRALANYERDNGVTSRNQWLAAFEPNYKFSDRLFAFALAQYERDRFAGFDSRVTLSGGLGYRVVGSPGLTVDVKAGPAWRHTDFIGVPATSDVNALGALDATWTISPTLTLSENATALYASSNTNLTSITALSVKLGGKLSARASYQIGYNSDPPPLFGKTDTLSRLTLVYGF